jgi:hypothetical protein
MRIPTTEMPRPATSTDREATLATRREAIAAPVAAAMPRGTKAGPAFIGEYE